MIGQLIPQRPRWAILSGMLLVVLLTLPAGSHAAAVQANPHGADFNFDCTLCHSTEGWTPILNPTLFEHGSTGFPLEGRHDQVDCQFCHETLAFEQAESFCSSCHLDVHEGQFGDGCEQCHTPDAWLDDAGFREMHQGTRFPLSGPHAGPDCAACHATGQYANLSTECASCHLDSYESATSPDHTGYPTDCAQCHGLTSTEWPGSVVAFDHTNRFPLEGGHNISNCQACHPAGQEYGVIDATCVACHQIDFNTADDPNHVSAGFSTDCTQCHTITRWSSANGFDHGITGWPLLGEHREQSCVECHSSGYTGTSSECISCHRSDYNGADDHVRDNYPLDCTLCHTSFNDWEDGVDEDFDHNRDTQFPLTGAHEAVDCTLCHVGGGGDMLPLECVGCHDQDATTADVDHSNFPSDCTECHSTNQWEGAEFDHDQSDFPLTGAHITTDCLDCHTDGVYDGLDVACFACHEQVFIDAEEPVHEEGSFDQDCTVCHTTDAWVPGTFDHNNQTDFLVEGAHTTLKCIECHTEATYDGTPLECIGCHQADYDETDDPDHSGGMYPENCVECHNQVEWEEIDEGNFPHDAVSEFPLTGGHADATCTDCHADGYTVTDIACASCHQADFDAATDPIHQTGAFDSDCATCHNVNAWAPSGFDHDVQTSFVIDGAHANQDCATCHIDGEYLDTPNVCLGCHQADFDGADDPPHQSGAFDDNCAVCHGTAQWAPSNFDHDTQTNFVLDGEHLGQDCTECHVGGDYLGTPETCYGCHQADYEDTDDPDHVAEMFPMDCTLCHTTSDWDDADFNHDNTAFPLTGAHQSTDCTMCHTDGYTGTPQDCFSCHEDDATGAADPPHSDEFDDDCSVCHTTDPGWSPAPGFDHTTFTGVELLGAHGSLSCTDCHVGGVYDGTPTVCIECHQADYDGTSDPQHGTNGYPTQCTQCHGYDSWADIASFDHNAWTAFELTGAHVNTNCTLCHTDGYAGTSTTCVDCHLGDAQAADDPIHTVEFGTDCTVCHTTTGWSPSQFSHQNFTGYPLSGAHVFLDCATCHVDGNYADTPNQCVGCHQDDYDNAAFDHSAPGFDTQCQTCHGNVGWTPTTYDHGDDTGFDLNGSHALLNCVDCHIGNQYDNTPDECIFCHQADWDGTNNPDHADAGFPTDCSICHNAVDWDDANFAHDPWFPIYTGEHENRWDSCEDCHTTGNFNDFTCAVCHTNGDMIDEHDDVGGFSLDPQACLFCHPDGEEDGPYLMPELIREPSSKEPR